MGEAVDLVEDVVVALALLVDLTVLQEEEMEEAVVVEPALPVETMVLHPQVVVEDLELETATVLLVTTWLDTTAEDEEEDVEDVNPEEESPPPLTGNKSATSLDGLLLLTEFRFNEIMEVCPNEGNVILYCVLLEKTVLALIF